MESRIALVTGAAGGIGEAVVRALGERGVRIAAVDQDGDRLRRTVGGLVAEGHQVAGFVCDVTSGPDVESTVESVESELGPVDYLVNAAGVLRLGEARSLTDEDWLSTFAVNTTGVFHMCRAVANRMVPARAAASSPSRRTPPAPRTDMAAYAASKAAASMFTKSLGLELARHGIRCNVVAPGSTETPMLTSMWQDESGPKGTIEGRPEAFRVGIPLGRLARPSNIADAVVFLLSDQSSHITLHDLTVDGGAALGV